MRLVVKIFSSWLIMLVFPACEYTEGLLKEGNYIEMEENLKDEFHSIVIETSVELLLEQSAGSIIKLSGMDFILNDLIFTVEDGVLFIQSMGFDYRRKDRLAKIHLPIKVLKKITINASAEISNVAELAQDQFTLIINGRGSFSESHLKLSCQSLSIAAYGTNSGTHLLEGYTNSLRITMEGLATTDASAMLASNVSINQRSQRSIYVNASESLLVNMYSSGNVYYTGQAHLDYRIIDPGWNVDFGQAIMQ